MRYRRMPIEIESPEQLGYGNIDCNLTESSFRDAVLGDLDLDLRNLVLCYGDHVGHPGLRALIAADGAGLTADDVLVTPGAAGALFFIATSLLEPGDRLLVAKTNYATNIETPRAMGIETDFHALRFEDGFRVDVDRLAAQIRPETRLISLTNPHNPTGTMMDEATLRAVVRLAEERGLWLLVDETYRDMAYGAKPPLAATLSDRAISVSSLSKTYGLPGIRIGWILSRNPMLKEKFLAAKEQVVICNSVVDEEIAFRFLQRRDAFLPAIRARIAANFATVKDWFAGQRALEWVEPSGGVVCFPRFRADFPVDLERFYEVLNREFKTYVGPGHWFEESKRYMRIGFGWPTPDELARGLVNVTKAAEIART